jgi:hypothetical protein
VVAAISDARQAAYFRDLLTAERALLNADIASLRRQLELEISTKSGNRIEINRLHLLVWHHQTEMTTLERLVGRLEARFTADWAALDAKRG